MSLSALSGKGEKAHKQVRRGVDADGRQYLLGLDLFGGGAGEDTCTHKRHDHMRPEVSFFALFQHERREEYSPVQTARAATRTVNCMVRMKGCLRAEAMSLSKR